MEFSEQLVPDREISSMLCWIIETPCLRGEGSLAEHHERRLESVDRVRARGYVSLKWK